MRCCCGTEGLTTTAMTPRTRATECRSWHRRRRPTRCSPRAGLAAPGAVRSAVAGPLLGGVAGHAAACRYRPVQRSSRAVASVVRTFVDQATSLGAQMALEVAALHAAIVRCNRSRSRESSASAGSGESISRNASMTFPRASARVRPWLWTPLTSGIDATTQPSSGLVDDRQIKGLAHLVRKVLRYLAVGDAAGSARTQSRVIPLARSKDVPRPHVSPALRNSPRAAARSRVPQWRRQSGSLIRAMIAPPKFIHCCIGSGGGDQRLARSSGGKTGRRR
jgi:hypothetical protein